MGDSSDEDYGGLSSSLQAKYNPLRHRSSVSSNHQQDINIPIPTKHKNTTKSNKQSSQQSITHKTVSTKNNYSQQQDASYNPLRAQKIQTLLQNNIISQKQQQSHQQKHQLLSQYQSADISKSYLYEQKKFKWETNQKSDRVKSYQRMNMSWRRDKFLSNNHIVHNNESREGRKLHLDQHNNKFKRPNSAKKYNKLFIHSLFIQGDQEQSAEQVVLVRDTLGQQEGRTSLRDKDEDAKGKCHYLQQTVFIGKGQKLLSPNQKMRRSSRRSSEDHSATKKRSRKESSSPRRDSPDKSHRKRDDKKDEKKSRRDKSPTTKSKDADVGHVLTRRMSQHVADVPKDINAIEGAFEKFPQIHPKTVEGLKKRGIHHLFPVQYESFNAAYARKDMIVRDLTGSGKTLGFCLPMVEYFRKNKFFGSGKIQGIVLAPTRELALQVTKELNALKHSEHEYNILTVYGGVSLDDQTYQLRKGVDIFVGTTGRVLDHMERRNFDFSQLKNIILDEADQMLKLGFKEDVDRIIANIKEKASKDIQIKLFSATVPPWVKSIARQHLKPDYVTIDLAQNLKNKTSKTVNHLAINCPYHNRISALADVLMCYGGGNSQCIVFCSTKAEANSLLLTDKIKQDIEVMHGDIAQNQREVTLKRFKENKFSVLVATDVASRGLDIPNVDLVVQVEPPKEVETYIHRSGRTARAGKSGTCITFYSKKHLPMIQQIEQKAGIVFQKIGVPQPEDVIKATSKGIVKNLEEVNDDVLPIFEDTAKELIEANGNDPKRALLKAIAYLSGHYKTALGSRSLLTGQENYITFDMVFQTAFGTVSFVWAALRRAVPESIVGSIRGMRMYRDNTGVVFDVPDEHLQRFEDIFVHMSEQKKMDFTISRAKKLADLKEDGEFAGAGGGYGNRVSYGAQSSYGGGSYGGSQGGYQARGGYGGQQQSSYGQQSYGGQQSSYGGQSNGSGYGARPQGGAGGGRGGQADDRTIFVGNLQFNAREQDIFDFFRKERIQPSKIRMLQDQDGKFKGAAFVEFESVGDMENACKFDGKNFGNSDRRVRINPAGNKPAPR